MTALLSLFPHDARVIDMHKLDTAVAFAGGGGSSHGIKMATGKDPGHACNHDAMAMAMHEANHPGTVHFVEDVWKMRPGRQFPHHLDFFWASPDCKHFSKAKGGKPVDKKIRGLAWFGVKVATQCDVDVIAYENVEEFVTWGPLGKDDRPDKKRRGETFRRWVRAHERLGYVVDWRVLNAADFGAPTRRKRLFVIARKDGKPIVWPEPTHGPKRALPWRTAADCINWLIPCPSIFDRKKPLAAATQRRIARGIVKYVIGAAEPFVIHLTRHDNSHVHGVGDPLPTVTSANRGELALIAPTLVQTSYGERKGQAPRSLDLGEPLGTVVAGGIKHALVAAFLAKNYGGHETPGSAASAPVSTVTCQDHHSLVTSALVKLRGTCRDGQPVTEPMPTLTAGGTHVGEVRAFLTKFYGNGGAQPVTLPLDTVTTKDRFGLVVVNGEQYEIADIGFRMLTPRELFRAQGFPDDYVIDPVVTLTNKKTKTRRRAPLPKTAQVRMAGNAVVPQVAAAIVRANFAGALPLRAAA